MARPLGTKAGFNKKLMRVKTAFENKLLTLFSAAALVVATVTMATWKVARDEGESDLWVEHSHTILESLVQIKSGTIQIELSRQSYMISGDAAELSTRAAAFWARETQLYRVSDLTADNPRQQERMTGLRALVTERLAISDRADLILQTEGPVASNAYIATSLMQEKGLRLYQVLREMEEEERRLMDERTSTQQRLRNDLTVLAAIAGLALMALLSFAFLSIRADITERKRVELALIDARDAADMANLAKDSFLATMSHEIRTPLGGLIGMLELLGFTPLRDDQRETVQYAMDSGQSLLRIVNDVLDWSKIEAGKLELSPQPASITHLVSGVLRNYAGVASAKSLMLEQHVDARLSPAHIVDPLRLSQVLNNFASNALKFTAKGRIKVRAELLARENNTERVRFSVVDTGIGITEEAQQFLFQNYRQGNVDTARMYGGTGLGLSICRRLAAMMDGEIDLVSAPDQGSTFSITLNLTVAAMAPEPFPITSAVLKIPHLRSYCSGPMKSEVVERSPRAVDVEINDDFTGPDL